MTELSSVKSRYLADSFRSYGSEDQVIGDLARRIGLELTKGDRRALAETVRRLAEQVRAADVEFEHDDPFPAYLA
jgi:hypothetical protein